MANNYPLPFLCMVLFGEVFFSVFSSALGCLSRCYSCHPFVSQFFDVILEKFQPITLHSIRSWTPMGTFLVCWVTILVVICMWSCFISFLSELNSFSHFSIFIVTLSCSPNVIPKSPTFLCVRLFASFKFSIQLSVHSFLILLEQSVNPILFNYLIILLKGASTDI